MPKPRRISFQKADQKAGFEAVRQRVMTMKRTTIFTTLTVAAIAVGTAAVAHGDGNRGDRGGKGPMMDRPEFSELDTNSDGTLSPEELTAPRAARFATADANGDGTLSAEEMAAHAETMRQERAIRGAERMIERMDTNEDGQLSVEEMTARADGKNMFDRLDKDEDGAISEEEFAKVGKGGKRMRGHEGGHRGDHGGKKRQGHGDD